MDLKRAVQTAAKFTATEGILSRLRSIPKSGAFPARIFAQDGLVGVLCDLDEGIDVPNATLDTTLLSSIVKEGTITKFGMTDHGVVEVEVGASKYRMEETRSAAFGPAAYRGFPKLPEVWNSEPDWKVVQKAFHAVAKEHDNAALTHVAFRPDGLVYCCDSYRVVRVKSLGGEKSGLLPVKLFKHWPNREVWSCFSRETNTAFFRLGLDELRMGSFARDTYPDLKQYLPDEHPGSQAVVEVGSLIRTVKRASALSPVKLVKLEFDGLGSLVITAWNEEPQTYCVTIPCECDVGWVVVSGKFLLEALSEVETPNVWLGYGDQKSPLRIEAPGDYLELIWPFDPESA